MTKLQLPEMEVEIPDRWRSQGMLTFTLPFSDRQVKPNVIMTVEHLPEEIEIYEYFSKIERSIRARQIQNFKLIERKEQMLAGVRAMRMVCEWDVTLMKIFLGLKEMLGDLPDQLVMLCVTALMREEERSWVSALEALTKEKLPDELISMLKKVKQGTSEQVVRQLQISAIQGRTAVNITASLPAEHFDELLQEILQFVDSLAFRAGADAHDDPT